MDQPQLIPDPKPPASQRKVQLAVKRDMRALKAAEVLDERAGIAETLVVLGEALDRARRDEDTWAGAAAARELRQCYALLGVADGPDELDELLRELSTPVGDTTQP